jgi:hypothetical protein
VKRANLLSDAYAMLQYCYQHDEWNNTEKTLVGRLVNGRCETVNHMSDIDRQPSALIKRPQPLSVLIRVTLSD